MDNAEFKSKPEILLSPQDFFRRQIDGAVKVHSINASQMARSYLVGLLEHYLNIQNLYEEEDEKGRKKNTTLAETFLKALNKEKNKKIDDLKKLGDRALYISGFFGDSLVRKIVHLDYYVDIGGAAYRVLSESVEDETFSKVLP